METVKQRIGDLAKEGIFGPGKFLAVKLASDEGKGEQFMSQLFFLAVEMEDNGKTVITPVVVKVQVPEELRDVMGTIKQFANEVTMYARVLPELGPDGQSMCPKMYYGFATDGKDPDKDLIVLEDIRASGFVLVKGLFLDHDHLVLAMRKLGRFHGFSYKAKKKSDRIRQLGKELHSEALADYDTGMMHGSLFRGFRPLMEENPGDVILKRAYEKMSSGSMTKQWDTLRKPEEPFAVMAHGDFNKNNLMYKYDGENKASDIKIFDFGTAKYSDPAVDISFCLYMNTTSEMREAHWDGFLQAYWDGVTSVEEDPGFSFEEFLKQFAKRAVWGYLPCSFYLPMLMFPEEMPADFSEITFEQRRQLCLRWGGDEGETAVVNVVRHLHKRGYLEEYVNNFQY